MHDVIDLDAYPVCRRHEPDGVRWLEVQREHLARDGVLVLPGFLRPEALPIMVAEAERLESLATPQDIEGTPYLGLPEDGYPDAHPRRHLSRSALTAIAYDLFPADSLLRAVYEWDELMHFVAALLGVDRLYRYADPFGALNVAVMREGDELGWHFDQTDFVVSIALQSSAEGGDFENAAQLRSEDDEHHDDVAAVLAGEAPERVRREPMTPGCLMLFQGRCSLHRVTPIRGDVARHVALLAYDTRPGTDSSDLLKLVRYGRLPGDPVPVGR